MRLDPPSAPHTDKPKQLRMKTYFLSQKISLFTFFLFLHFAVPGQIASTQFPNQALLTTKKEWQHFWDDFGLGRYNNSGAQFPSMPIVVDNGILTIPFSKGDFGGAGHKDAGGIIYKSGPHYKGRKIYLEEFVKFSENFDWGEKGEAYRGGKFGLSVTVGNVGVGRNPGKGNFQVTSMWRGGGAMDAYIYHAGQEKQGGKWPDRIIYTQLERGKWYKFGIEIALNDPGENNGEVKIWIDNQLAFACNAFHFSDKKNVIFQPSFASFFGGDSDKWQARNDCEISYRDISIWAENPNKTQNKNIDFICNAEVALDPLPITAGLNIYPNPAINGRFNLKITNVDKADLIHLRVLDMTGRQVLFQPLKQNQKRVILPSNLPLGIYLVQVATQNGNVSQLLQLQ